jgi:hypothetical protein
MLTFYEEIMVLLLHDENGTFLPVSEHTLNRALTGAVLMDLAFANRIDTDPERMVVIDSTPTGDPLLDRVLARMAGEQAVADSRAWIETLSAEEASSGHDETIRATALEKLVQRGVLERREEKLLWVFRSRRYPTIDGKVEQEAKKRIADVLFTEDIPDPKDVALICLVDSCNILPTIFSKREIDRAERRIEQLRKMDLIGRELGNAINDIEQTVTMALSGAPY